jgi:hypothetical protein
MNSCMSRGVTSSEVVSLAQPIVFYMMKILNVRLNDRRLTHGVIVS